MPAMALFSIRETLDRNEQTALCRGIRNDDHRPVLLKVLSSPQPTQHDVEAIRHEFEVGHDLATPAVLKPIAMATDEGRLAIVYDDFAGSPLTSYLGAPMEMDRFLPLARNVARAVAAVHQQKIIHKDIKPQNILVNPQTLEVRIIGLGIATRLPREEYAAPHPTKIEGALPYISPEQTGRMNRPLDSRSDLYSLGVVFYEMLTGRLPFQARDPLEWIHCHIARVPRPPIEVEPTIPHVISELVSRLLLKNADDRYQTAAGIEADLTHCLTQWEGTREINPFILGEKDTPNRLVIPQKLYGREKEIEVLNSAFDRVAAHGTAEWVMVAGYSGVGKTSLVRELYRPVTRERGLFISGKFDQYRRGIPYATIVEAFREVVAQILAESEETVATWRSQLAQALGGNGQLIVDVIPQVELIIGKQQPVAELPPAEAQNRFNLVFRNFIGVFATREHPLVLFLDDMQWVDPAGLKLLVYLAASPEVAHLLLIGAYRDNEVTPLHPLMLGLEDIKKTSARLQTISVGPLALEDMVLMLEDTVHSSAAQCRPLAEVVHEKTAGNPFFAIQFLATLYEDRLVAFNAAQSRWQWDVGRIRSRSYSDNVVDLMVRKLERLPSETRSALQFAACIGTEFHMQVLSRVVEEANGKTERALEAALQEGLLVRRGPGQFAFLHDRVQQAAYSLIPEAGRGAVHLGIGRTLLAMYSGEEQQNHLFEILEQVDSGVSLIEDPAEKHQIADLNLQAARKATLSTAYKSAQQFALTAWALLQPVDWSADYLLNRRLYSILAEAEFLNGNLARSEELIREAIRHLRTNLEKAEAYNLLIIGQTVAGQYGKAVESGRSGLALLGIDLPAKPPEGAFEQAVNRIDSTMGTRQPSDLLDAPLLTDPVYRVAQKILLNVDVPSYIGLPVLYPLVVANMVQISLNHGNSIESCKSYGTYGLLLIAMCGKAQRAFEFARLGWELVDKLGATVHKCKTALPWAYIQPWVKPLREGIKYWDEAIRSGQATGDLQFTGYAYTYRRVYLHMAGEDLLQMQEKIDLELTTMEARQNQHVIGVLSGLRLTAAALRKAEAGSEISAEDASLLADLTKRQDLTALSIQHCYLAQRFVFRGHHAAALAHAEQAEAMAGGILGMFVNADINFYCSLSLIGVLEAGVDDAQERLRLQQKLLANQRTLQRWRDDCPTNLDHKYALVEAERARVEGRELDAMQLYERAIRSARESECVHEEGLSCELASEFYRRRSFGTIADVYLRMARVCYLRWGASGKVWQLERRYPQLAEAADLEDRLLKPTATVAVRAEQLDLLSIVKASQTISGVIDQDELLRTLLQVVLEQGGARLARVLLVQDHQLSLEAEARVNHAIEVNLLGSRPMPPSSSEVPATVLRYAQRSKTRVILDDAAVNPGSFADDPYLARVRPRSVLCLPILRQADVIALLYLENDLVPAAFTSDRLVALELLASQAAISIDNARLLGRERAAKAQARFVADASKTLAESLDYGGTLRRLARLAVPYLADWCVVDVLEDKKIRRVAGAHVDPSKELLLQDLTMHAAAGRPAARAIETGEVFLLAEVTDDFIRRTALDDVALAQTVRALRPRSIIAVPVRTHGQTLGAMTFASTRPELQYGPGEMALAEELGRRAAVAIEHARLYRDAQEAIQVRDEFITVASHELSTPVTSLTLLLQGLALGKWPATPERLQRVFVTLERQASRLRSLIDEMLSVARVPLGRLELHLESVDLVSVVRAAVEQFAPALSQAGCSVDLRAPAPVAGRWDQGKLGQVVSNLLSNALKFGPGRPIEVSVGAVDGRAALTVTDHGIGIAPEALPHIFEKYSRAVSSQHYGGLGLGLYIVHRIVEALDGSVRAESVPGSFTTFTVELPLQGPGADAQGPASPVPLG